MRRTEVALAATLVVGGACVLHTVDVPLCPGAAARPIARPTMAVTRDLDADGDGDVLLLADREVVVLRAGDRSGERYCRDRTIAAEDPAVSGLFDPSAARTGRTRFESFELDRRGRLYVTSPDHWTVAAEPGARPLPTGRNRVRTPFRPDWAASLEPTGSGAYGRLTVGRGRRVAVQFDRRAARWVVLRLP